MHLFHGLIISLVITLFSNVTLAEALPKLRITVIASGTVNWELQYIKNQQLDRENGYELVIQRVASVSGARIAVTAGNADVIVSDWLWASERNSKGEDFRFIPFSRQVGSIIVDNGSDIKEVGDLKGKRVGVAGGPSNKGWILIQAAAKREGMDLKGDAKIQFAAPPLLTQALKKGQLDALVTFWHYGSRLKADGYQELVSLEGLMDRLGLKSQVPMLGYLLKNSLIQQSPGIVDGFYHSITAAKHQLSMDDSAWNDLRPLMRAENDAIFRALIAGYRFGIPEQLNDQQIQDAQAFYKIIDQLKPYPTGTELSPMMFYRAEK